MQKNCVRLGVVAAVICFCPNSWGQGTVATVVKGEVHGDLTGYLRGTVELTELQSHRAVASAEVGGDGTFELRRVPYGEYQLTVSLTGEPPVYQGMVSVQELTPPIQVQLTQREKARPAWGPVSVAQLLHPPAKKAIEAFASARKFADAKAYDKAAEELEKAIKISPDYADAYINLAVQHIHMARYEQSIQELAHAAEVGKPTAMIYSNMAYAQFMLQRDADAMRSVRQSLDIDPNSAAAHYLMGSLLAQDVRTLPQAVPHLEIAARTLAGARQILERAQKELAQIASAH